MQHACRSHSYLPVGYTNNAIPTDKIFSSMSMLLGIHHSVIYIFVMKIRMEFRRIYKSNNLLVHLFFNKPHSFNMNATSLKL